MTGATGFVGICLLEKLLRSVDVGSVHLLVRPRGCGPDASPEVRRAKAEERLVETFKNSRFDDLRKAGRMEELKAKCHAVAGDLISPGLAVGKDAKQRLVEEFSGGKGICFHVAADVAFNRPLNEAIGINVHGAVQVVELCEALNVAAFVHCSTLYVNSREPVDARVFEKTYPLSYDAVKVYEEWRSTKGNLSEAKCKQLMSSERTDCWTNTYCMTKSMAERVVTARCQKFKAPGGSTKRLPLCLNRLGIVTPALKEGRGWYHGAGSFLQLFVAGGKRIVTILPGHGKYWPDLAPVDTCTNTMLAAAAKLLTPNPYSAAPLNSYPHIYHNGSGDEHPELTILKEVDHWVKYNAKRLIDGNPIEGVSQNVTFTFIENESLFWLCFFLRYDLPYLFLYPIGFLIPAVATTAKLLDKCRNGLRKFLNTYSKFLMSKWIHDMTNTRALYESLSESSRAEFDFDLSATRVDIMSYMLDCAVIIWNKGLKRDKERGRISAAKMGMLMELLFFVTQAIYALIVVGAVALIYFYVR